jgi:hypothetical protein
LNHRSGDDRRSTESRHRWPISELVPNTHRRPPTLTGRTGSTLNRQRQYALDRIRMCRINNRDRFTNP